MVRDYGYVKIFQDQYPDLEYLVVDTVRDGLLSVSSGRADAFISAASTASYLMSELGVSNLQFTGKTGLSIDLALGVRSDWPVFVSLINKVLNSISLEEKNTITSKWITLRETKPAPSSKPVEGEQTVWWLIVAVILVFALLLLAALVLPRLFSDEDLAHHFGSTRFRMIALTMTSLMIVLVAALVWRALDQNKRAVLNTTRGDLQVVLQGTVDRLDFWVNGRQNFLLQLGRNP